MQKTIYFSKIFRGCLMLTVLLLCGCAQKSDLKITTSPPMEEPVAEEAGVEETLSGDEMETGTEPVAETIYVQVTGAVRAPGVYMLPAGARVFEAVQMAGGMTDDAAADSLNQALEVTDGQMLVLYTQQEWEQMQKGSTTVHTDGASVVTQQDDGRININTASLEQLCTISGIGQSRAQSIITYREQNGAFGSIEEIMNVSGIKDGLFQKIKDKIKV